MGRFREFLRTLKPGEVGFINTTIGLGAFTLAFNKHVSEKALEERRAAEEAYVAELQHVVRLVSNTEPLLLLQNIKRAKAGIRREATELVGLVDPSRDELADEWLRRRNGASISAARLTPGAPPDRDPETLAAQVNRERIKMKRMWNAIVSLEKNYPGSIQNLAKDSDSVVHASKRCAAHRAQLGAEVNEILGRKTLMLVEPLDKACCRLHPSCEWERDGDQCYSIIRRVWDIPEAWPADDQNEDDYSPGAPPIGTRGYVRINDRVPTSRLAQAMAELQHKRGKGDDSAVEDDDAIKDADRHVLDEGG